ncbi:MAG: flavin reductase family protein [Acidobacteriota bacterium]
MDGREFRRCCGQFATGVAVACVFGKDNEPHGLTVNSFSSVSLEPPLVLICIGHDSGVLDMFHDQRRFGLSFLRAEQRDLSNQFAMRGQNRFDGVAWHEGESAVPILDGTLADMECEVERAVEAGDHDVIIARVRKAMVHGGHPLLYFNSAYASLRG